MKEIALFNNSNKDVIDYPIAEAVLDSEGNPKIDPDIQQIITTDNTFTWSLKAGETKVFPAYVANYLKHIYGFLDEVELPEGASVVEEDVDESDPDKIYCKVCGKEASNIRGLGLHIASKHPEMLS